MGAPNKLTSKIQPELNMWNTVSVLKPLSTGCSTFEIHVCSSSNYTQLVEIGTYRGKRHHVMLEMAKT